MEKRNPDVTPQDNEKGAMMQMLMEANGREVFLRARLATADAKIAYLEQQIAALTPVEDDDA